MSTADADPADYGRRLATGFAVLAECWRQPTPALVEAINRGELDVVGREVDDVALNDLRAEHARLFVGPAAPPCPPYESVYRDGEGGDPGKVLGPSTHAVVGWYRQYGLGLDPDWPDLPDHVATELEFVAHLLDEGLIAACERFLEEHPRQWLDAFTAQVEAETDEPHYEALARATREALETV